MTLLVNIIDEEYERLKRSNFHTVIEECVRNGIPIPDNATNGQVIQTLFKPNRVERTDDDVIVENYDFSKEWWNAPYQKGGKE